MIPLRDNNPTRSVPVVTYLIIAINVAVFLLQSSLSAGDQELFVARFGLIPALISSGEYVGSFSTPLTSMFMHGGFLHLLFNMWSLFIFGDNVEDVLGRARYLTFYVLAGLGAALGQVLYDPSSAIPMVGASGAIAGVLAAYLRFFPRARVLTLIPVFILFFTREIPAVVFIVLWFAMQLLSGVGMLSVGGAQVGGVAVFAHIGGFIAGLLLVAGLRRGRNLTRGFRAPGPRLQR